MRDYPLIKFVVAFSLGLIITSFIKISLSILLGLLIFSIAISITVFSIKKDSLRFIGSAVILISITIAGMLYITLINSDLPTYPFKEKFVRDILVDGRVKEIELPSDNLTLTMEVDQVLKNGQIIKSPFTLLCNLNYEEVEIKRILEKLRPGNRITILGSIRIPPNQRNPGEFDYRNYLQGMGISALFNSYSVVDFVIVDYDENIIESTIFSVRYEIAKQIKKIYTPQTAGLLKGLLLADRSEIGYDVKEGFIKSGVIHVLAVSGLHVGFIVLILVFLFGRLNIYLRITFTIIGLLLFMIITGLPPSVTRATIMAILLLVSYIRSNKQNNYNTLSLAALFILIIDPAQIFNPGFQLSFSAVISIFIFFPRLKNFIDNHLRVNKSFRYFLVFLSVSLAAQLGTIPFTIYYFNKLSLISLFSNLIVIPSIGIILGVGILTLFVSIVSLSAVSLFVLFNETTVDFMYWLVNALSSLDFSYLSFPNYSVWDGIIYLVILTIITVYIKKFLRLRSKVIFLLLICANFIVWANVDNEELLPDGKLSILFVDVSHSEAAIVKFSDGKTAMVNFGAATSNYSAGNAILIPLLNKLGIEKIDYGIISHLKRDKYLGCVEMIEQDLIDTLLIPKVYGMGKEDSLFINYLHEQNTFYKIIDKDKIKTKDARIYFLSQLINSKYNYFDIMNKSAPVKIQYANTSVLFMGGTEERGEELLIVGYNKFLNSDILHLANYGSNVSISMKLLDKVNPKYSIISVGIGNFMEYPSEETLNKTVIINSNIFRTDEEGALLFVSDGATIKRKNWRVN